MTVGESPSVPLSTAVDGVEVLGAISPSRAGDFMACPLMYRFRTIDRLPEPYSPVAVRGTLIHKVLEDLFDLPAGDRTPDRASEMLVPAWEALLEVEPELAEMFTAGGPDVTAWLTSCRDVLERYFSLEDPRLLEPAERELYVETLLDSKLLLRGFVDRLDVAPDGRMRVVDYKGLAVDTPLPTPSGWTTMSAVQVGDELMGSDGRPVRVTAKSATHHRACYRIRFLDGTSVVCDNVHLWTVVSSRRQRQRRLTVDTEQLYSLHQTHLAAGRRRSLWIEAASALDLPDTEDLPADPWLLGVWLGDGASRSGQLTIGRADAADMLTLLKERWDGEISVKDDVTALAVHLGKRGNECTYGHSSFKRPTPGHPTRRCSRELEHAALEQSNLSFAAHLTAAGVRAFKHIPAIYLRAGTQQRIDLLRGLMDSDGWWNRTRHRAGFTTTDDRLASDVLELLRTLGMHATHFSKAYTNPKRPPRNWHVIEFTPTEFNPFMLPRKALQCDAGVTTVQRVNARRRIIASIEPMESVPTQCITVDARDSLFLCGEGFVPTHNSGTAPGEGWEAKALFQMKFYALVLWRTRGVVPAMLQLVYLGSGELIRYVPDEQDLRATERKVEAIWRAIAKATESGDWRPNRSKLCEWCSFQSLCPEFGGTPPPLPVREPSETLAALAPQEPPAVPGDLTAEDVD